MYLFDTVLFASAERSVDLEKLRQCLFLRAPGCDPLGLRSRNFPSIGFGRRTGRHIDVNKSTQHAKNMLKTTSHIRSFEKIMQNARLQTNTHTHTQRRRALQQTKRIYCAHRPDLKEMRSTRHDDSWPYNTRNMKTQQQ